MEIAKETKIKLAIFAVGCLTGFFGTDAFNLVMWLANLVL
jgi:hypothetical protein